MFKGSKGAFSLFQNNNKIQSFQHVELLFLLFDHYNYSYLFFLNRDIKTLMLSTNFTSQIRI